ncbi:hypothetical protein B0T10DRAFT_393018 [Thelonectria olida]|uniref:Uncharacterized protein n=1 Tax=Thelonectria olida TaxID=1576542 RepID=A0A9P8WIG4_9HYPO|nr:hypothetical protein B0T10DRAFT_393018 [Thelonectria olida]
MLPIIRPVSKITLSGTRTSTATLPLSTLAPLTFDKPSDLRIVLVPTSEDGTNSASDHPHSDLDKNEIELSERHVSTDQGIPRHPVPSMQEAFAESLLEVTNGQEGPGKPKLRELDAKGRREKLIEQGAEDDPFDTPWRYRPGQEQHEVYKLISQITFGVYLLLNGLAADNTLVVSILQGHIDEVDEFLEVMLEDFAQAHQDLTERIAHLQLPMGNRHAFEGMLEDRAFRAQILAGNEKIDHILARTNAAMKQWDDDIDAGLRSSEAFMDWLNEQKIQEFPMSTLDLSKIYQAMKGNSDGWLNAFDELNNQAQELNGLIIKLMTIVAEMEKTAGEVSRKTWANIPPFSLPAHKDEGASSPSSSHDRSATPVASIRSGESAATLQPPSIRESLRDPEVDTLSDFPLPGSTPLLPPRMSLRPSPAPSPSPIPVPAPEELPTLSPTVYNGTPKLSPSENKKEVKPDTRRVESEAAGLDDGPLFILQPRTYTPKIPEPLPSPMVKGGSPPQPKPQSNAHHSSPQVNQRPPSRAPSQAHQSPQVKQEQGFPQKKTSLRQRVSQKTTPPESIHIPPRNAAEARPIRPTTANRTPTANTPMTGLSQATEPAPHASDLEVYHQHRLPRATSHADFSAPVHPPVLSSPHSEQQQYYHPVRASPHSPLQQRPHTADPHNPNSRPSGYFPGHVRQQPSRLGGMSTLSSVTTATYDDTATVTSRATTQAGGKRLKKKKSAFGWLKKAFSMDENEKADYQARRAMQYQDQYYEGTSPKFLDGRRLR